MVVLFDLDGVVLDTESQYTVLWNNIAKSTAMSEKSAD